MAGGRADANPPLGDAQSRGPQLYAPTITRTKEEQRCRPHSSQRHSSARPASRSPASGSAPGRSAAAAGSSAGARRTTTSRSPRSTARSSTASTGSTPPPPTASATPSRSSAARIAGLDERPYVFTKASLVEGPGRRVVHSLKRDSILREVERSLERLGVDAIDLYQIHWPIPERGHRGGLGGARRAQGAGPRAPHRRLELRRRAAAADPADRAGRDAAAAVLAGRARRRGGDPAVRRARGHRRDRLLADGLGPADRAR